MSILIHGVSMPKDGLARNISIFEDGDVRFYGGSIVIGKAIELPPHGRLGDLDALIDVIEQIDWYHQAPNKEMVHGANSEEHQAWYKEQDIYEAIENAETIIPADQGGEPT